MNPAAPLDVSLVLPVRDEASTVVRVLRDYLAAFAAQGWTVEAIVLDDASADGSADAVADAALPTVRLVRQARRQGYGALCRAGSAMARGRIVVWTDADGTYTAADAARVVLALGAFDQVVGVRATDHGRLRWLRLATKQLICVLVSLAWGRAIPDLNCGLRAFRMEALRAILTELPDGFSCTSTATLAALNRGQRLRWMPIAYEARATAAMSKFRPVVDAARLLAVIARQWRRRRLVRRRPVGTEGAREIRRPHVLALRGRDLARAAR